MEGSVSPTRTKSTWKPRVEDGDICFLPCDDGVALWLGNHEACLKRDNWRSPIFSLPCCKTDEASWGATACAGHAAPLGLRHIEKTSDNNKISLWYQLVGGFNSPALEVYWDTTDDAPAPWWVAVKTYTGIQIKYPTSDKLPPLVFGLADEDAYCYCDLDPCQECVANCKRGFLIYAWYGGNDIVTIHCGR